MNHPTGVHRPGRAAWRTLLVAASLGFLSACAGTTRIGEIMDDPGRYDGETVRVRGEVTESVGIPIAGGAYRIDDGSGTLTVVNEEGSTPTQGAEVQVTGVFRSVFTLGARSLSVLLERERDRP